GDSVLITGSKDTEQVMKVDELATLYQEEINDLNTQYYEAMSANDQDAIKAIQERSMEMVSNHAERVKATIRDMNGSFASLAPVGMIDPRNDFEFLDSLMSALDQKYPNTKMIVS